MCNIQHLSGYSQFPKDNEEEDEEGEDSLNGELRPTASDFEAIPPPNPQLGVLTKPQLQVLSKTFKPNFKRLNDDLVSEINLERQRVYRERFNLEENKFFLKDWKKWMNDVESDILFFDFIDAFYPTKENTVKTITKSKWVKDNNTVISSSHPPMETIKISHLDTEVKASPYKTLTNDDDTRKFFEQNNFTNQYLHTIGKIG